MRFLHCGLPYLHPLPFRIRDLTLSCKGIPAELTCGVLQKMALGVLRPDTPTIRKVAGEARYAVSGLDARAIENVTAGVLALQSQDKDGLTPVLDVY